MKIRFSICIFLCSISFSAYPDLREKKFAAANIDRAEVREQADVSSRVIAVLKNHAQVELTDDFAITLKQCRVTKDLIVKGKKGLKIPLKKGAVVKIQPEIKDSVTSMVSENGNTQLFEIEQRYIAYNIGYNRIKSCAEEK